MGYFVRRGGPGGLPWIETYARDSAAVAVYQLWKWEGRKRVYALGREWEPPGGDPVRGAPRRPAAHPGERHHATEVFGNGRSALTDDAKSSYGASDQSMSGSVFHACSVCHLMRGNRSSASRI